MPTPTLPELQQDAELTALVQRAARILREVSDHGFQLMEEPECVAMKERYQQLTRLVRAQIEQLGATPNEARQLYIQLNSAFTSTTNSIKLRAMMSLEQAMGD